MYPEEMRPACVKIPVLPCLLQHHSEQSILGGNLSEHQWMNKENEVYRHVECYPGTTKETLSLITTHMNLEDVRLSEIIQAQKINTT